MSTTRGRLSLRSGLAVVFAIFLVSVLPAPGATYTWILTTGTASYTAGADWSSGGATGTVPPTTATITDQSGVAPGEPLLTNGTTTVAGLITAYQGNWIFGGIRSATAVTFNVGTYTINSGTLLQFRGSASIPMTLNYNQIQMYGGTIELGLSTSSQDYLTENVGTTGSNAGITFYGTTTSGIVYVGTTGDASSTTSLGLIATDSTFTSGAVGTVVLAYDTIGKSGTNTTTGMRT